MAKAVKSTLRDLIRGKPKKGEQKSKLETVGIDGICDRLVTGESQQQIANSLGMTEGSLRYWLSEDSTRSARAKEARKISAETSDYMAERVLIDLPADATPAQVVQARELASHYRWRAKTRDPANYGEKLDLNHSGKIELTDEQVDARLGLLLKKAGINKKN